MAEHRSTQWLALLRRELQEYRVSLVWTPLAVASLLAVLLLGGVLVANQFSNLGEIILRAVMQQEHGNGLELDIRVIVDDSGRRLTQVVTESAPPPDGIAAVEIESEAVPELAAEQFWDFTKDWEFSPPPTPHTGAVAAHDGQAVHSLNPLLQGLHLFMLVILVLVSLNYLLGCLYNDRKDRSILFWRSMPVSTPAEVLAKLAVALLVAPAIFIGAALLAQLAAVLMAVLLVLRMGLDPLAIVLGNIQFGRLLLDQVGGWLLTALWLMPLYGWLLLASAVARRSPFLLALTPVLGLMLLEALLFGSSHFASAVLRHMPQYSSGGSAVGLYPLGPDWARLDYLGLVLGLLVAAPLLLAAMWWRRHRWEI